MLDRNKRKMGIALLLFAAAAMLFRLAYATVSSSISIWLMAGAVLLLLASLTVFGLYFRE
jgi:hypothetical protein